MIHKSKDKHEFSALNSFCAFDLIFNRDSDLAKHFNELKLII